MAKNPEQKQPSIFLLIHKERKSKMETEKKKTEKGRRREEGE